MKFWQAQGVNMNQSFAELGIHSALVQGLRKAGITMPTQIQEEVIPEVLAGKDVVGQSATGTGKTLAFLLPLFQKIDHARRDTQAIILAPTHELAMQIFREAQLLADNSGLPVTAAVIIGDVNIARQIDRLKERPHLLVGSSGRILELIQKRKINAQTVKTIVLDEADRLMDDNHRVSVAAIIKATQKDRQLLLFSATIPATALEKAVGISNDAVVVAIAAPTAVPAEIEHLYFVVETRDKIEFLRKLLASLQVDRALVFINTSAAIEETVAKLCHHGVAATGIHGSSVKKDRQGAMESFRDGRTGVLVASDLAARGLDIAGVRCVINLELPEDPQAYQHRAGRTGRAGATGMTISIVDQAEEKRIAFLQKKLNVKIMPKRLAFGKIID
jgi:superfamily II DNA/RNA helicase